jgi:hypothetical protein
MRRWLIPVVLATCAACSTSSAPSVQSSERPPTSATSALASKRSAVQAAHQFLAAYQAGDAATLRALTNVHGEVDDRPGDLGTITNVHWGRPSLESTPYGATVRPDVYVPFNATTTGHPYGGTAPRETDWAWGLVLARQTTHSPWLVVDQGVG